MKRIFSVGTKIALTALLLNASSQKVHGIGLANGVLSLFLECNNDGTALVLEPLEGWQYSQDAIGDMTDGSAYDFTGMAAFQDTNANEIVIAIAGNEALLGTGFDRNIDKIFTGDVFFTAGSENFENSMAAGNLHGVHFSNSRDSGADKGQGVYQNVAAKGVGMNNFGHRTYNDYESLVDSTADNFYGDFGADNPYFNGNGPGYNVIAGGNRVTDDGFEMLNLVDLQNRGFDGQALGGTELVAFKFNLDTIVPPEPPKDLESLRKIAEGYGYGWDQDWDDKLQQYDGTISSIDTDIQNAEVQVEDYQGKIDAHQEQQDIYKSLRNNAEAEAEKRQKEIKSLNGANKNAVKRIAGGEANHEIKKELSTRDNIVTKLNNVQKIIDAHPSKLDKAESKLTNQEKKLEKFPSEKQFFETAKSDLDPSGNVYKAYAAVAELQPKKDAWEQYKTANHPDWETLDIQEKLNIQSDYNNNFGDWIELRDDGTLAKQEQELTFFKNDTIANFETQVAADYKTAKGKIETKIEGFKKDISNLNEKLKTATADQSKYQEKLDDFYKTHSDISAENSLKQKLDKIVKTSTKKLNQLNKKNSLTEAQKQEKAFHEQNIADTNNLIAEIYNSGNQKQSLDTVLDRAETDFDTLTEIAKTSERANGKLDKNDFKRYIAEDLIIKTSVPYENGNTLESQTEENDWLGAQVGDPKTVGSKYEQREFEAGLIKIAKDKWIDVKNKNESLRAQEAKDKNDDINSQNAIKTQINNLTAQKQNQIDLKNELLREIETTIIEIRDEAIAAENKQKVQQFASVAAEGHQQEIELEEKFGKRDSADGGVPTTAEEAEQLIAENNSARVPEPSSLMGLIAVIGGSIASFGRRSKRQ